MTFADVAEGVRAAIARYTLALDDGRVDDVVATYCPDGTFVLMGSGTFEGHDALRETYTRWTPRVPQRHLVLNTLVTGWDDHEATATSDVVLLVQGETGWAPQFVARYDDVLHRDPDADPAVAWRFHRRSVTS